MVKDTVFSLLACLQEMTDTKSMQNHNVVKSELLIRYLRIIEPVIFDAL